MSKKFLMLFMAGVLAGCSAPRVLDVNNDPVAYICEYMHSQHAWFTDTRRFEDVKDDERTGVRYLNSAYCVNARTDNAVINMQADIKAYCRSLGGVTVRNTWCAKPQKDGWKPLFYAQITRAAEKCGVDAMSARFLVYGPIPGNDAAWQKVAVRLGFEPPKNASAR